jgi:hypothetical protein
MSVIEMKKMQLTSVSAVGLVSAFCLNLPIQTAGRFVWVESEDSAACWNIKQHSASLHVV